MKKPLLFARELVANSLAPGGRAVDATCGNGNDTVFLCSLVGETGHVLAMDTQEQAISRTRERLNEAGYLRRATLVLDSHAALASYLDGPCDAAMFNLGYLPGGDHSITTQPHTTLAALGVALASLKQGGVVTLLVYTGHAGGPEEYRAVREYCSSLPQRAFTVLEYSFINQANNPPLLLAVTRL